LRYLLLSEALLVIRYRSNSEPAGFLHPRENIFHTFVDSTDSNRAVSLSLRNVWMRLRKKVGVMSLPDSIVTTAVRSRGIAGAREESFPLWKKSSNSKPHLGYRRNAKSNAQSNRFDRYRLPQLSLL